MIEHPPGSSLRQAGDARYIAAFDLASNQSLLKQPHRFRLEGFAAFNKDAKAACQGVELEQART